jgi:hypothetical protein
VRSVVGRGGVVAVVFVVVVVLGLVVEECGVVSKECGVDSCVVVGGKVVADVCGVSGLVMEGEGVMGVAWGKVESIEWRKGGCQTYNPTNSRHTSTRPPKDHSPRVLMLVFYGWMLRWVSCWSRCRFGSYRIDVSAIRLVEVVER